jgi:futalosine hydrolase
MHALILIPTDLERRVVAPLLRLGAADTVALCGFGMVAAAARTAGLVAAARPRRVVLVGIAGRFPDGPAVGTAAVFAEVGCDGIGVGTGAAHRPAARIGWPQWPGDPGPPASAPIGDALRLDAGDGPGLPRAGGLLTVAAASATAAEAQARGAAHPAAVAEDMEGFAVALACALAGVPCTIVRGIANDVGDRDHDRWQTRPALAAAAELVNRLLTADRGGEPVSPAGA